MASVEPIGYELDALLSVVWKWHCVSGWGDGGGCRDLVGVRRVKLWAALETGEFPERRDIGGGILLTLFDGCADCRAVIVDVILEV